MSDNIILNLSQNYAVKNNALFKFQLRTILEKGNFTLLEDVQITTSISSWTKM